MQFAIWNFFLVAGVGLAKPHVLFVSIDDMNDYISPLDNHPGIKTPNFDRLAKRSVTFANALCRAGVPPVACCGDDRCAPGEVGDLPEHVRSTWAEVAS